MKPPAKRPKPTTPKRVAPGKRKHGSRSPSGKRSTGVRELKAHLSAYLRRVKEGETVAITDRGAVIAHLVPAPSPSADEAHERMLQQMEREGLLASRPTMTMEEFRAKRRAERPWRALVPPGTMQRILDEDRADRF